MIRLFLLLLPLSLFASNILSYNIYDRTERVDVMITFDTPYDGTIKQSVSSSKIIIKLYDASIESSKLKQLSSKYINSLSITPISNYTQIVASVPNGINLKASKTSDSYGLRLRFSKTVAKKKSQAVESENPLANLPTKKNTDMSQSYYIVIAILILGIAILFYIKTKVVPKKLKKEAKSSPLMFHNTNPEETNQKTSNEVSIRFQKQLNNVSNVVMLDFGSQSYLVLMGNNNILLDKFNDNIPTTQDEFESILQTKHQELSEFLQEDTTEREPLQTYKEKAASISYGV